MTKSSKATSLEILACDAGWRNYHFVKLTTEDGIVAVPIMAMMMVIVSSGAIMGRFKARRWLVALGWFGTALMALAVLALLGSSVIG